MNCYAQSVLLDNLESLSSPGMQGRKTNTQGAHQAALFIAAQFKKIALQPISNDYRLPFKYASGFSGTKKGENLVAQLLTTDKNAKTIVFTAHYDHLGKTGSKIFLGADDNASGVAAMIEIARRLSKKELKHNYLFVATDAEENGIYGAKALLENPIINRQAIVLNVNLDMLAVKPRKGKLLAFSDKNLKPYKHLIETNEINQLANIKFVTSNHVMNARLRLTEKINWRKASDHYAFIKYKIPYIYYGVGTHKNYHTTQDSFENIDPLFFSSAVDKIYHSILALDKVKLSRLAH